MKAWSINPSRSSSMRARNIHGERESIIAKTGAELLLLLVATLCYLIETCIID